MASSSGILFLAEPITSRLFLPASFGQAAVFTAGVNIVGFVACLRYEMALVLPKEDNDARSLFALGFLVLASVSALTAILTFLFGQNALSSFGMNSLAGSLWLFPLAVFLVGLDLLLCAWYTRFRQFPRIGLSRTMLSIPRVSAEFGGGFAGFTSGDNLVLFRLLGLMGPPLFLARDFVKKEAASVVRQFDPREIGRLARRYIKFPVYDTWSTLLMVVSWNSPIILMAVYYGDNEAGLFGKALYLISVPALVVGESVSQVFLQASASRQAEGKPLGDLVEAVLDRMISFGTLPFCLIAVLGPEVFSVVLGSQWSGAGVYAQLISPWVFMTLVHASITTLFGTLDSQRVGLISNSVLCVVRLSILVLGGVFRGDPRSVIFVFSGASFIIILWRCWYLVTAVKGSHQRLITYYVRCLLFTVPAVSVVVFLKWLSWGPASWILVASIIASIPYAIVVLWHDDEVRSFVVNAAKR